MLSALPAAEPAEVDASVESLGLSETLVGGCGAALEPSDGFEREGEFSLFGGALALFVEDFTQ